jgi:hypothetical protein
MLHAMRHSYYLACERYQQTPSLALARQLHSYAGEVQACYVEAGDTANASLWAHNVAYWLDVLHRAGVFPAPRRASDSPPAIPAGTREMDAC